MSSPKLSNQMLLRGAQLASTTWPIAKHIFPEKLEIDDNQALWVHQIPDYQPAPPLKENISADLVIIGGGFTGVSTAYHFSRRYPEKRVVLLEAKTLANGASGRNGGMMLNWLSNMYGCSPRTIQDIYRITHEGIRNIDAIIKRHQLAVSYRIDGTFEIYTNAERAEGAHRITEIHRKLGIPVQYMDTTALKPHIDLQGVHGAIFDPNSGQLNGAQLVRGLRPVLIEQGVEIYEQTPVTKIQTGSTIHLTTPHAEIKADAIVLATNGYTSKLGFFRDALLPLHSHVFATDALSPEQLAEIGWHKTAGYADDLDRIAYSSLTSEGHIVFGGGSNQSYAYLFGNRTRYPHDPKKSFDRIRQTMQGYLPKSPSLPIKYRWTGTLGITFNRNPLMGVYGEDQNIYYAIGYCGHGVTLANVAGEILTDLYSRDDERWRGLPFYQAKYAPIPPEPFRWLGYQMFTRLTGKSPRV